MTDRFDLSFYRGKTVLITGHTGFKGSWLSEILLLGGAKVVGYSGKIEWDTTKPNGTPRKLLDVSKATALGWTYKTELEDGIRLAYENFLHNPVRAER